MKLPMGLFGFRKVDNDAVFRVEPAFRGGDVDPMSEKMRPAEDGRAGVETSRARRFSSRSISRELTLSLVLLLLVFEGILLAAVYGRQSRILFRELESKADEYAANLGAVLAVPIWDFDDEQIARIGSGFARRDVVELIHIKDTGGRTLYLQGASEDHGSRIRRSVPIVHRGQAIGEVSFSLSMAAYQQDLLWLRNTLFLVLFLSLVVISVTTGLLLRIYMRKPLAILQRGIDRVAQGEYEYGFEEVRHSELTDIARRFRQMAAEIRAREDSLQKEAAERRRGEEIVRQSEAKSRALIDALPDLIFQFDRQGTFIDAKGAWNDLPMAPENLIDRKIEEVFPKDVAATIKERLEAVFRSGRMQFGEFELHTEDRSESFECRLVGISDEQALAVVRNITDSRKAAAEKYRLEEQLQRARKMEAIGMLAGGVAHDLNNVLSGVVSYPQLLLMDLPEDSPLRKPVQTIQASGEKAASIVQDLLTLARRGVSVSKPINLNEVVKDYLKSPEYEQLRNYHPGFELELDLEPELMRVSGSPFHLSKTVMNLVSNAAEAIEDTGTVTISTENRYIDRPIRGYDDVTEGDYVVLQVSDTGVGISDQDIDRVFEPFYTKKVMGRSGTGLGMAVVWGTVKDHNGYIDIESRMESGTSIRIFLPVSGDGGSLRQNSTAPWKIQGRGETILVADDVAEQREIAESMLTRLGYHVAVVESGEAAVEYLKDHEVDLVILDMIMEPGIDGLETFRRILKICPEQKVIITSGYSETGRVRAAETLGVGAYVKKPYLMETIGLAIRAELDRRR